MYWSGGPEKQEEGRGVCRGPPLYIRCSGGRLQRGAAAVNYASAYPCSRKSRRRCTPWAWRAAR